MISERTFYYTILLATIFSLFVAFSPSPRSDFHEASASTEILNYNFVVSEVAETYPSPKSPFLDNSYVAFKEALAFKESQGKYRVVNTLGYLGKYQFGASTLERFKIYNTTSFLHNPELQEQVFIAYCKVNKWILRKDITRSVGKVMNGVKITESGILAAAHLSGAGNVKKYLRSNGLKNLSDAYGSSIKSYMKNFAGYDVSFIKGDRQASI